MAGMKGQDATSTSMSACAVQPAVPQMLAALILMAAMNAPAIGATHQVSRYSQTVKS